MSTTDCGQEIEIAYGQPAPEGRLAAVWMRTKSVWRVFRNRLAANRLHDLDDHALDDIGLTRHDVVTALDRSGVRDDPTRLLAGAARERARDRFSRRAGL